VSGHWYLSYFLFQVNPFQIVMCCHT